MADTKLSALSQGLRCASYYGTDVASGASKKFFDLGWYNVRNYGAVGNGVTNDATAIQAAVDAATTAGGGIIFFPPGTYKVTSAITFDEASGAALRIIGCGGGWHDSSVITTDQQIYIFYCHNTSGQGGGQPYESVEHLNFKTTYSPGSHGTITSTELADGAYGCIYMTVGLGTRYESCGFFLNGTGTGAGGIAVFESGSDVSFNNCYFSGTYNPSTWTHAEDSFGLIASACIINNTKFNTFGTALNIAAATGAHAALTSVDLEENGCAILVGECTIGLWTSFIQPNGALQAPSDGLTSSIYMNGVGCESNGDTDSTSAGAVVKLSAVTNSFINELNIFNFQVDSPRALWVYTANETVIQNMIITNNTHGYTTAAVDFQTVGNLTFVNCFVTNTVGTAWNLPTSNSVFNGVTGLGGLTWEKCNTDGAVAFSVLPSSPIFGAAMVVSDSVDAAYSGGVSNFGKTISASSSSPHKVLARWNGSNWTIAG